MSKHSKKFNAVSEKVDRTRKYSFEEGIQLALECAYSKFDESMDVAIKLGVDPRHADQMVRGSVSLPNGLGKEIVLVVFAKGEKEKEALDAGADYAGSDDLVAKIQQGWLEFDKTVATPDMMGAVGKIGRILGPRGMMPNVKLGTVTFDVGKAVREIKAGKIDFKVEKAGIVHASVGKVSFGVEKIHQNIAAFIETIQRLKPPASKGTYLKGIALSSTMGPGIKIDTTYVKDLLKR